MPGFFSLLNRFNLIKPIPVFSKLNWLELRRIAKKSIVVEYRKSEIIRKQGDPADFFYCLISGRLQAYTVNYYGIKSNVEFIHRGMHFGVISVLTGESHSSNYEAINDSVILKISKDDFHDILKSIPELGIELSQSLSKSVRRHVQGISSPTESMIISIYSPAQGTGSSTYAAHLALSLQKETKKRVVLVTIQPTQKIADLNALGNPLHLREIIHEQDNVYQSIIKGQLKIDILNVVFDATDVSLKRQISPLVSTLVDDYRYVIVDLPNDMDDFVFEALTQSDEVHLVTLDRASDLELSRNAIDRLETTFKENFKAEKIHVIIRAVHDKIYLSYAEINKAIDFNVYTTLPQIKESEIRLDTNIKGVIFYQVEEHCEYAKAITRIARQIGGVMVGLVLGGGAALGVAHIGVIRVLEKENIPIDVVVGSSMGALIASFWAVGKDSYAIEKAAREFQKPRDMMQLMYPCNPFKGLVGGRGISRWLGKHLGDSTFYATKIPLKVIAYDIIRREEIVIESGSLVDAVRKSVSIPGVIIPIKENDKVIIDGGVLNPLPTNVLAKAGIKKIIAVNVLQSPEESSVGFDLSLQRLREEDKISFSQKPVKFVFIRCMRFISQFFTPNTADIIVRTLQASEFVIAQQSAQLANIVIRPDLRGINWFELYRVDDLIKKGEEAAQKVIPQIKSLIES